MYKVRFNLSAGVNFMKWKVTSPDGTAEYLDPSEVELVMFNAILRNQKKTAKKIFDGAQKSVCAWVDCEEIIINRLIDSRITGTQVSYNPRIAPNWVSNGESVDGKEYVTIVSHDRKLFAH